MKANDENSIADEPQITSTDPKQRILARRLRIQRRNATARKRLQALESGDVSSEDEETILEQQVEKSTVELLTLAQEGEELITNVRVASDAHEVKRRAEHAAAKEARIQKLEEEASIAQEKFDRISSKWENIIMLNDPLDLHQETEMQREKCKDLIAQKDQLIAELKAELKQGDVRFVKDQQQQADDISLLVERIDNQVAIMRRAYRRELILIEQAVDIERKETMLANNKRWEALYKQREEDEINNLEQRFVALSEHNQLMMGIMVHHQEKYRSTKISLEKDIQILQQQLELVKAICLLNKEKMEYNYQVLKKRDEESLLIRSQQKRRINKLQDMVMTLRRKIQALDQSTQAEVKKLTSEIIKLHRNIKDILVKADHFCTVNETKYFQLWKFNHDCVQKLLDKILSIDRLIHEQQLGIECRPVSVLKINKQDLSSYKAAVDKRNASLGTESSFKKVMEDNEEDECDEREEMLLRHILEVVADRSGFLIEDRLNVLLAPYTHSQKTLVRVDNVFSALGVTNQEDIRLLRCTMEPYIVCLTCQPILGAVRPITPNSLPPPEVLPEEEMKDQVLKKLKQTLEEGEKIAHLKKDTFTAHKSTTEEEDRDFRFSEFTNFTAFDSNVQDMSVTGDTLTWGPVSYEPTLRSLSVYQPSRLGLIKCTAPSSLLTMTVLTNRKPGTLILDATIPSNQTVPSKNIVEAAPEDNHDGHILSIDPVFVLKALKEFVQKFQATKHRYKGTTWGQKVKKKESISRQLTDEDVKRFWQQFRKSFPSEKEKLWDCLYMGLQRYHTILQDRHRINTEIEHLRVQNADLRRLLQKYALPNNMRPTKGPRQGLPPLSAKTPPAPACTPSKLVLSFNNSSRL